MLSMDAMWRKMRGLLILSTMSASTSFDASPLPPSLHTGWTIQQMVTEEFRILEVFNYELATHTPAAWIEVFEQRLSLWCQQQSEQSRRLHIALVPVRMLLLERTFKTSLYRELQTQSCWDICVVPLRCVLDFVSNWQESLEVLRSLWSCATSLLHQFCACCSLLAVEVCLSLSLGECLI